MPLNSILTAIGFEKVRIASEENFKANDIAVYQSSDSNEYISQHLFCRLALRPHHT